ncbi:MAG: hypothetical protein ABI852_09950, partial [Gemmatimonadaceae bacterium]
EVAVGTAATGGFSKHYPGSSGGSGASIVVKDRAAAITIVGVGFNLITAPIQSVDISVSTRSRNR